jgi:hypothetical protein
MKVIVPTLKPRNPGVAASRVRRAGAHRRSAGGERRLGRTELARELLHERTPRP